MEMGQKVMWIGLHKLRYSAGGGEGGGRGIEKCSSRCSYCLSRSYSAFTVSKTQDLQTPGNKKLRVPNQKNLESLSQGHRIWRFMNVKWKQDFSLFH